MTDRFAEASAIADAALAEAYLTRGRPADPHRVREQAGMLVPAEEVSATGEPAMAQAECLCVPEPAARLAVRLRFLHLTSHTVEVTDGDGYLAVDRLRVGDREFRARDEAVERAVDVEIPLADLREGRAVVPFLVPSSVASTALANPSGLPAGRTVARAAAIQGEIRLSVTPIPGPHGALRIGADLANTTAGGTVRSVHGTLPAAALIGAHLLLGLSGGRFLSLTDPPEWARAAAEECVNVGTWPVLVADGSVMLCSPSILGDHPTFAAEDGTPFDGAEVDAALAALSVHDAPDPVPAPARSGTARGLRSGVARHPRREPVPRRGFPAGAVTEAVASDLGPGARETSAATVSPSAGPVGAGPVTIEAPPAPAMPAAEAPAVPAVWGPVTGEAAGTEPVVVAGVAITRGSRVRFAPRPFGRAAGDAHLFGLTATVQAVVRDPDGGHRIAVTVDDDPGAVLQNVQGRYRYVDPEDITPLDHRARPVPGAMRR